jgi:basic membrane protein A
MFQHAVAIALGIVISLGAASVTRAQPRPAGPAPPRPASQPPLRPTGREMKVAMMLASDKSSTDAGLAGLEAAKKHGRLAVTVRLAPWPDELSPMIDRLAAGAPDLIIGLGPVYRDAFRMASAQHPHARFLLLDAELPSVPNVRAATFRADEGSFLAGVAASAESKRGAVGFIGAMETPISQALECGYETGIRWAARELKRTVRGSVVYIGTTPQAFSDPEHGSKVSRTMITEKHVDVLYAAAGAASAGVIEAAREAKVRAIGGDAEPTHRTREVLITSVRKRIDRVIERAIADVRKQSFHGGIVEMNLANGGVDLALPGRMAPATQKLVERARAAIVSGREAPCVKYEKTPSAWNFPPRPAAP